MTIVTTKPRRLALAAGPALAVLSAYLMSVAGFSNDAAVTLGITVICVIWWVFEPIPIPATSLIPLGLLPLFAATLALPIIWPHGLAVAVAAVPFLRRGDQAARQPGWERAADPRTLAIWLAAFVGGALLLALIPGDLVQRIVEEGSANIIATFTQPHPTP